MSDLDPKKIWRAAGRVFTRFTRDRIALVAAGIAFYGLLALFPGIAALVAIAGLVLDRASVVDEVAPIVAMLPQTAADIILGQISEVAGTQNESLGLAALAGLLVAIYSASRGVGTMIEGLNIAYEEDEKRGFIAVKALTLLLTGFVFAMLTVQIAVVAAMPAVVGLFADLPLWENLVRIVRWPVLFVLAALTLAVLYRFGPSRNDARWRWIIPGGLVACLLWLVATFGFTFYVERFGSYNETFGALGGVIILLTWLWLSAVCALLGALIDAELEAQLVQDTTVGHPKPPGSRGAVKADATPQTSAEDGNSQ